MNERQIPHEKLPTKTENKTQQNNVHIVTLTIDATTLKTSTKRYNNTGQL